MTMKVSKVGKTNILEQMEKLGFVKADPTIKRRLILSISGLPKTGKNHFAFTAPGPIAVFSADIGLEGVINKFTGLKDIITFDIPAPGDLTEDDAKELWNRANGAWVGALRNRDLKSIVVDTSTEMWELLRIARFGKLTQVMPFQYGPVNSEYRKFIRQGYDSNKNIILLHKMKPVYINDKRTKNYEMAGFGDTGFLVQTNCQTFRDDPDPEEGGESVFSIMIRDSRHDPSLNGQVYGGPMCNFPMLASMMIEGTVPSDWE